MRDNRIINKISTNILFFAGIFVAIVAVCFISVCIVSFIPGRLINTNAQKSYDIIQSEGMYPGSLESSMISDNFTNVVMISEAMNLCKKDTGFIKSAMLSCFISQENNSKGVVFEYPRYWHGYLVFLKPALIFFDIHSIRHLMILVTFILLAVLSYMITKLISKWVALAFILSFALFSPNLVMTNLTFFSVFAISMIASIVLLYTLKKQRRTRDILALFLIIGGATSFFDFLTAPIITLGIPLVLLLAYRIKQSDTIGKSLTLEYFGAIILWFFGYVATWVSKWIIASLILQENVVSQAIKTVAHRSSNKAPGENITIVDLVIKNFSYAPLVVATIVILVVAFAVIAIIVYRQKSDKFAHRRLNQSLALFLLTAILPVGWILYSKNHSFIHYWMTHRDLIVLIFAMSTLCVMTILSISSSREGMKRRSHKHKAVTK
jgi:hypothetical protein